MRSGSSGVTVTSSSFDRFHTTVTARSRELHNVYYSLPERKFGIKEGENEYIYTGDDCSDNSGALSRR